MKKILLQISIFLLAFLCITSAQTFDGEWSVEYVTSDSPDSTNSAGLNVISVAVVEENSFVALVNRGSRNSYYLVAYRDAGKNSGMLTQYPYNSSDIQSKWINFFDQEFVYEANDLAAKGNLIYVANNEEGSNSVLVFELQEDSLYSYAQRYKLFEYIWAIDLDDAGRVYVTKRGDSVNVGSVVVLDNPDNAPAWSSGGTTGTILQEFDLPEVGDPRGITVNGDGTVIYVSNFDENKVYCYTGDPATGYTKYEAFDFSVDGEFIPPAGAPEDAFRVGPHGLQLMPAKNLLFIAHDANYLSGDGYEYGRIYIANPNTGEVLDTINTAEWNFAVEGRYDNHNPGNNASGYASNYAVDFDENMALYTQSWFGWTVDKWLYSGVLPTVELTITSVEVIDETIPNQVSLSQNYPNPFNPSTTIEFKINREQQVDLAIYNLNGELVTKLVNSARLSAGSYKVTFNASKLASGNYFYKLNAGGQIFTNKMTLIK